MSLCRAKGPLFRSPVIHFLSLLAVMFVFMTDDNDSISPDIRSYVKRLRALLADTPPLEVLGTTVGTIEDLTRGLENSRVTHRPLPGKWSISEIVAHLSDSETASRFRFRQILTLPDGWAIPAYDQDAWAEVSGNSEIPLADSLELFSALRRSNLRLWQSLTPAQLAKFGQHQERGRESVENLLVLVAGHDVNHLNQIRRIVSQAAAEETK